MFKILMIGGLLYTLYKLVFPAKSIQSGSEPKEDDTIDIDYEEMD